MSVPNRTVTVTHQYYDTTTKVLVTSTYSMVSFLLGGTPFSLPTIFRSSCLLSRLIISRVPPSNLGMAAKQPLLSAEDLKDVLECPVCLRIPRSAPIFQCERGHVVCSECHPKLVTCPVCRLPLGKTRSLISEKVLAR